MVILNISKWTQIAILTCRRTRLPLVFRNHFNYQTEKYMKIILFKNFSHIKDVKVLKDKYQESLTVATLNHQLQLILPTSPCPIRHCFYMKKMSRDWERSKTNLTWNFAIEHIEKEEIIYSFCPRAQPLLYWRRLWRGTLASRKAFNQPGKEQQLHLSEEMIVF